MNWYLGVIKAANFVLYLFVVLGLELSPYTLSHSTRPFLYVKGFIEIGSRELFA
jgi:hypothetical protein